MPLPPEPAAEADLDPPIPVRRIWPWFLLAALLAGSAAGAAVALGMAPGIKGVVKPPRAGSSADAGAPRPSASASASAAPGPRGLVGLVGSWVGNGRELSAVMVGHDLEFRVKKPDQFPRQGYEAGDARFVLRATAEPTVFAVEDHIRPALPIGKLYDARARGTCQEIWTTAAGDPLRARFEGGRLSVEFAKIEPATQNFTMEGLRVTSCVGLRDLKATKVLSILSRQ
jgi:serine/threonine-protein kinase